MRETRSVTLPPDEASLSSGEVPRLRTFVHEHGGRVVMVGNCPRTDIERHLERVFEKPPDRVSCGNQFRSRESLVSRIKMGTVALVVLCEGFLNHSDVHPIRIACKNGGIPLAFVNRGGIAAVRTALQRIDQCLAP